MGHHNFGIGQCANKIGSQSPLFEASPTKISSIVVVVAPPGATFQINVRPPLRMVSGVSASAKIAFGQMLVAMVGGVAAAPVAPLAFGRWLRCVVKGF